MTALHNILWIGLFSFLPTINHSMVNRVLNNLDNLSDDRRTEYIQKKQEMFDRGFIDWDVIIMKCIPAESANAEWDKCTLNREGLCKNFQHSDTETHYYNIRVYSQRSPIRCDIITDAPPYKNRRMNLINYHTTDANLNTCFSQLAGEVSSKGSTWVCDCNKLSLDSKSADQIDSQYIDKVCLKTVTNKMFQPPYWLREPSIQAEVSLSDQTIVLDPMPPQPQSPSPLEEQLTPPSPQAPHPSPSPQDTQKQGQTNI